MANHRLAIGWLQEMPEIRLLQAISEASGIPIRIHGGFARNLLALSLMSSDTHRPSPAFTDLIDPFSDIDLIVPGRADIEPLIRGIQSRIGIASSLRWEVRTAAQIDGARETSAATTLDAVEIGVSPDHLEFLRADAAEDDLSRRVLTGTLAEHWRRRRDSRLLLDLSLFALRAARFAAQFGLGIDERLRNEIFTIGLGVSPTLLRRSPYVPLALIDVLFTASDLRSAWKYLDWSRDAVPALGRRYAALFNQMRSAIDSGRMYAVVYPSSEVAGPVVEFHADGPADNSRTREIESAIPWTPIRLPRTLPCCPSVDFSLGPLTIAWRGIAVTEVVDMGAVVLVPSINAYEEDAPLIFGVPSLIDSRVSTVARLDWAFAAQIAGPRSRVFVGARKAL